MLTKEFVWKLLMKFPLNVQKQLQPVAIQSPKGAILGFTIPISYSLTQKYKLVLWRRTFSLARVSLEYIIILERCTFSIREVSKLLYSMYLVNLQNWIAVRNLRDEPDGLQFGQKGFSFSNSLSSCILPWNMRHTLVPIMCCYEHTWCPLLIYTSFLYLSFQIPVSRLVGHAARIMIKP